jgi:hypothetical protein
VPSIHDRMPKHLQGGARRALGTVRSSWKARGLCRVCGRPLGFLAPLGPARALVLGGDDPKAIGWYGAELAMTASRDASGRYRLEGPIRFRFPCVRACGAAPVYLERTLRAKYEAARAAGQPTVAL